MKINLRSLLVKITRKESKARRKGGRDWRIGGRVVEEETLIPIKERKDYGEKRERRKVGRPKGRKEGMKRE